MGEKIVRTKVLIRVFVEIWARFFSNFILKLFQRSINPLANLHTISTILSFSLKRFSQKDNIREKVFQVIFLFSNFSSCNFSEFIKFLFIGPLKTVWHFIYLVNCHFYLLASNFSFKTIIHFSIFHCYGFSALEIPRKWL